MSEWSNRLGIRILSEWSKRLGVRILCLSGAIDWDIVSETDWVSGYYV